MCLCVHSCPSGTKSKQCCWVVWHWRKYPISFWGRRLRLNEGWGRSMRETHWHVDFFFHYCNPPTWTHTPNTVYLPVCLSLSLFITLITRCIDNNLLLILSSRHKKKFSQCLHTEFCWLCTPVRFNSIQTTFFIPVGQFSFSLPVVSNKTRINQAFRTAVLYFIHMAS